MIEPPMTEGPTSMTPRSILLASPYLPPHLGGVETYVFRLATMLRDRHGWRVVLATTTDGPAGVDSVDGLRVHRLRSRFRVSNTPIDLGWIGKLRAVVDEEQVDLVNAHAPTPGFADAAARAAGSVPFVLTYHSGTMRKGRPVVDLGLRAYERFVLAGTAHRSARVICCADSVRDAFAPIFAAKSTTVPPGVHLDRFAAHTAPEADRLLFVASLEQATAHKGLGDLLRAIALLRDRRPGVVVEVAGDGNARTGYERLAADLGILDRVSFRGGLDQPTLAAAYQRCSLLVLPTRHDSYPTVLIEAMASGRPVLSTHVGDIAELVRDGVDGELMADVTPAGLADTLARMLADPARLAEMGRSGRDRVTASLSWEHQSDATVEVYEQALAAGQPTGRPFGRLARTS
jgi:glycosyltransferase involved in cell wall biosynthesis